MKESSEEQLELLEEMTIIEGEAPSLDVETEEVSKNRRVIRMLFHVASMIGIIGTVLFVIYGWQKGIFSSSQQLEQFVGQLGSYGAIIFIFIQIVQVVIPIIPGGISCLVGVVVFGPFYGFIYNYIGIVIGSMINFSLARHYGKPFVLSVVSKKTYDKYIGWINRGTGFDKFFALAIFMPVAPDDFLCMLAGLTKMSLKRFTTIILICKPPSIVAFSLGLATMFQWLIDHF